MTPIIDFIAKHFAGISANWSPEATSIASAAGLLQAISEAGVYLVDEAEFDTTKARDDWPAHFEDGLTVAMPAPVLWIEYKAYAPPTMRHVGRSAFLAVDLGRAVRVILLTLAASKVFMATHGFDLPKHMISQPGAVTGRPFVVGTNLGDDLKVGEGANFFMELLSFIALGDRLNRSQLIACGETQRRFIAEIGERPKAAWRLSYTSEKERATA